MWHLRNIARGVDVRDRRTAVLVRSDRTRLAACNRRSVKKLGVGADPDSDQRRVDRQCGLIGTHNTVDVARVAVEPGHLLAEVEPHPRVPEVFGDRVADRFAEARHGATRALKQVDIYVPGRKRLGHLDADVARADDRDRLGGHHRPVARCHPLVESVAATQRGHLELVGWGQVRPDRGGVIQTVEGENTVQRRPLDGS